MRPFLLSLFCRTVAFHAHGTRCAVDVQLGLSKNTNMTAAAIETQNLSKEYPHGFLHLKKKTSLEGLTMRVEDGEVFGFLGPNGAGKSTTIKLLMGIIFPTSGSAQILGKPVSDVSMHRDIGYLPEQPYFYDYLTGAEVCAVFGVLPGIGPGRLKEVCRTIPKEWLVAGGGKKTQALPPLSGSRK